MEEQSFTYTGTDLPDHHEAVIDELRVIRPWWSPELEKAVFLVAGVVISPVEELRWDWCKGMVCGCKFVPTAF